jgi:glycosyltransferase involved in cell wall biosynthesis
VVLSVSIVIPCRNEEGNLIILIPKLIELLLEGDEIILAEGGSTDKTWDICNRFASQFPNQIRCIRQSSSGKFGAVIDSVKSSQNSSILIWDADGTVDFDDNIEIYHSGLGDKSMICGDRLNGKINVGAMRRANWFGNWIFAIAWSLIHHKKPFDLLCGTKMFPKQLIMEMDPFLLKMDPFGDFAIIATAVRLRYQIKIKNVTYNPRVYGDTNIRRWYGGLLLLKVTLFVFFRYRKFFAKNA